MAGRGQTRAILAWSLVGAQVGAVAGAALWAVVVRLGLYDDRRTGWLLVGIPMLLGAGALGLVLRERWRPSWSPPALITAIALPAGAFIVWFAASVAGEGPEYASPTVTAGATALAAVWSLAPSVLVAGAYRWVHVLAMRIAMWSIGLAAIVCSLPFVVWVVGIPVLTWGRALMLTSDLRPLRSLWRTVRST